MEWHGGLHPQGVSRGSDLPPEESAKYNDIDKHQLSPSSASWATLRTRLSPATSTVTPTLPPLMMGLALLSMTTLSNSFPGRIMNLSTGPYGSHCLQGVRPTGPPVPAKARGRDWASATRESLPQFIPQNTENILTSSFHPIPPEEGEGLG